MIIEEYDFRLIPVKDSCKLFDLEVLATINKGKDSERQEFKNFAYGISLESALKAVANYRITQKYTDKIDLKTYLKEYREIINDISKLCEGVC